MSESIVTTTPEVHIVTAGEKQILVSETTQISIVTLSTTNSGGTPGGSNKQIQYNNSGAFAGIANSVAEAGGEVGLGVTSPQAQLHVAATAPLPTDVQAYLSSISTSGYSFGSGNKDYTVYSENSSIPIFGVGQNATFTEPLATDYDASGVYASFDTGGSGYTASGYDFTYNIWALYLGSTAISLNSASASTGTDPNDGSNYSVEVSWDTPSSDSPDGYLIQIGGSNPNSGLYKISIDPYISDNGNGWTSSISSGDYLQIKYIVGIDFTNALAPTDSYVFNNTTNNTWTSDTGPTTDIGAWSATPITVTPTGSSKGLVVDGITTINGVTEIAGQTNITGNLSVTDISGSSAYFSSNLSASGVSSFNSVNSGTISASGNISGSAISGNSLSSATSITGSSLDVSTGTIGTATIGGHVYSATGVVFNQNVTLAGAASRQVTLSGGVGANTAVNGATANAGANGRILSGLGGSSTGVGASNNSGGAGGSAVLISADGGGASGSTGTNTAGNGGLATIQTGNGGQATGASATTNQSGSGGSFFATCGDGGIASTSGAANNKAGSGGGGAFVAGNGGNASGATVTNVGGNGGDFSFISGNGGTGTGTGATGGKGGSLIFTAGNGANNNNGGSMYFLPGAKAGTGTDGDILLNANSGGTIRGRTGCGVAGNNIAAQFHVISTTDQQRIGYDTSNYYKTTVSSTGAVTFDAVGSGARFIFADRINIPTSTPASATATGTAGDICWDASFIYVCTATNTWKRVAIATW